MAAAPLSRSCSLPGDDDDMASSHSLVCRATTRQQPGNHHADAKFLFLAAAIGAAEVQPKLLMSRRTPHPKSLRRLRRPWMFPKTRLLHQRLIHSPPTSIRHRSAPTCLSFPSKKSLNILMKTVCGSHFGAPSTT